MKVLRRRTPGGWSMLREFDAGVGVADLVLVEVQMGARSLLRPLQRVPLRLAPLLAPDIAPHVATISAFMQATGMSRSSALRAVRDLVAERLAVRDGERVELRTIHSMPYGAVVAIEAKLRDWKRALGQAYRNRQFATQSWVVLDQHYPVSDLAIESFERAQVGLATCSSAGELRVHVRAETLPPGNPQRSWTAQAVIARSSRQVLKPLK